MVIHSYSPEPIPRTAIRLSWGAVFGGLVVATALQVVLNLLGAAIGLAEGGPGASTGGTGNRADDESRPKPGRHQPLARASGSERVGPAAVRALAG